ncbi:MAG: carbon-nitrogen family hydrolase [Gemmatimonadota bacterium]|nr:carbon-nitrogen family hydrolase [Gemmatimonadota bacterium]
MAAPLVPDATLRVALAEYDTGWLRPEVSLERAAVCVARAASTGARLVVLPEMCTTGFTMEPEQWAESLDGPSFARLSTLAARHDVWVMAGVAAKSEDGYVNVAAVFNPEGSLVLTYAKQRLFAYAGEDQHYSAGMAPAVIDIDGVRVTPFICYDLRFPELFRAAAPSSDLIVVIANWPAARRPHWDALLPARAIENLVYVAGVNRTGVGNGIQYDGGSTAYDPWGAPAAQRMAVAAPAVVDVSAAHVTSIRAKYPFLDDMAGQSSLVEAARG